MKTRFLIGALALLALGCESTQQARTDLPNFVIIFADDLGYGDLGSYGAQNIHTPHLDRMADDGLRFTSLYSISPVCSPSRAGLLTGRYPIRSGIHHVFFPESWTGIDAEEITIAEALKVAGYATGHVGKWHLGHHPRFLPMQHGFDEYFGIPYSNDMRGVVYLRGNDVEEWTVDQRYTTRRYTEESIDFIERHRDEPFFLYLAHSMPHVPLYTSPEFEGTSEGGLYGDVIEEIDWSVGQVLATLEELGLSENTLVVFTSDNGPWLVMEDHGGSAGPLREGKQFTFEGGMRVPAIAQWPGHIPAGSTYDGLATMMDWFPTFLNLASVPLPGDRPIDGEDLTGVLTGTGTRSGETLAYYMGGQLRAFSAGDWKVKLPYAGTRGSRGMTAMAAHDTLLFDLHDDLGESKDLSKTHPEELARVVDEMTAFVLALGEVPPAKEIGTAQDLTHYTYLEQKRQAAD